MMLQFGTLDRDPLYQSGLQLLLLVDSVDKKRWGASCLNSQTVSLSPLPDSEQISYNQFVARSFLVPTLVLLSILCWAGLSLILESNWLSLAVIGLGIVLGSGKLLSDTWQSLKNKSFALDYIAILAIGTGLITGNYLVAAVIVLMMSGGNALEDYAQTKAKQSLTALKSRLPNQVLVLDDQGQSILVAIEQIKVGSKILVRKGEVVALDGTLIEASCTIDESSLTGEATPVTHHLGELIRSGTVNVGQAFSLSTTTTTTDSTYHRIVELVQEAEHARAPFIQLADQLSGWFTLVTIVLAIIAYLVSGELTRVLAVLVIATPCPLILATPIALVGGMSAAARQRIIFKQLASLETLAKVDTLVFDKTGTLTLGIPQLEQIECLSNSLTTDQALAVAAALERNSLHPFAKAIVNSATNRQLELPQVSHVTEVIGQGLEGAVADKIYSISGDPKQQDSRVILKQEEQPIATFTFSDQIKADTKSVLAKLESMGLKLHLFTGDTAERAKQFLTQIDVRISVKADLKPEDKLNFIQSMPTEATVAMIGDGINDAPALAAADVGLVFSHQEHTASSEAADVVLLGGTLSLVWISMYLAKRTMAIAKQSMYVGLGLSLLGMTLAVAGWLPPLAGALTQEIIDVVVILNALRTVRWQPT